MSDRPKSFIETWIRSVAAARGETRPFDWFFRDVCSFEPAATLDVDDPSLHLVALFVPLRMAADAVFDIRQLRQMSSADYATALLIAIARELREAGELRAALQRRGESPVSLMAIPLMCVGLVVIGRQDPAMNDLIGGRHALLHDAKFQLAAMQLAITPDVRQVAAGLAADVDRTIATALGRPLPATPRQPSPPQPSPVQPTPPQPTRSSDRPPWPAPAPSTLPAPTPSTATPSTGTPSVGPPPPPGVAVPRTPAPAVDSASDPSAGDHVEYFRSKGVTTISFTVFRGMVLGIRDEPEGLVIDLTAEVVTFIARNAVGTVVGAWSDPRELISFEVPTVLMEAGVEGELFAAKLRDWDAAGAVIDVEWQQGLDVDVFYAIGRSSDGSVSVGTPAP